jgi:8-oxo-dGTP pyrophosphatase MutT (NUDIX family)
MGVRADFEIAGLITVRQDRVLLCRKKHTTALLILPGGTMEAGETAECCLRREVNEELGGVGLGPLDYLGAYVAPAAVPGKTVCVELFSGELNGEPRATAEIQELVWFASGDDPAQLAPSLRELIFPDLARRGLIWERD